MGESDSYQKLRQIYRDIQNGAKAFLAAEYRMCVAFIAVFGFAMIFFVARVDGGGNAFAFTKQMFHETNGGRGAFTEQMGKVLSQNKWRAGCFR